MSLQIARGVHISEDDWVGLLWGDDIRRPDVSGAKPVSTGHHVGHSHRMIDLKTNKYSSDGVMTILKIIVLSTIN